MSVSRSKSPQKKSQGQVSDFLLQDEVGSNMEMEGGTGEIIYRSGNGVAGRVAGAGIVACFD